MQDEVKPTEISESLNAAMDAANAVTGLYVLADYDEQELYMDWDGRASSLPPEVSAIIKLAGTADWPVGWTYGLSVTGV